MTDAPAIRAWLRDHGYDIGVKGAIPRDLIGIYEAAHPGSNGQNGNPADGPDYPDGMTDDDFGPDLTDPPDPPPGDTAENKPRRPRSGKAAGKPSRTFPWRRKPPGGKAKPKRPRVPVDEVIGGAWRILSHVAAPVPPLQRTLRIQAPVAGLLLEDSVKGTAIDGLLQPIARLQNQGKVVAALAGPPMLVTAGTIHLQRQAAQGLPPSPMIMSVIHEGLRESLMLWVSVAGPKFEEAMAREKDFEEKYGQDVDAFIGFLFSPPPVAGDPDAAQAEEEAIKRAQGIL